MLLGLKLDRIFKSARAIGEVYASRIGFSWELYLDHDCPPECPLDGMENEAMHPAHTDCGLPVVQLSCCFKHARDVEEKEVYASCIDMLAAARPGVFGLRMALRIVL